jgi:hypothetical protein
MRFELFVLFCVWRVGHSAVSQDNDCFLHFCRLLSRLKANYQLTELVKMEIYPEWIQLVASFTQMAFTNYQVNGVHCMSMCFAGFCFLSIASEGVKSSDHLIHHSHPRTRRRPKMACITCWGFGPD